MTDREGTLYQRLLEDGQEMVVYPMLYNDRICLGIPGAPTYDRGWCVPQGRGVAIRPGTDRATHLSSSRR